MSGRIETAVLAILLFAQSACTSPSSPPVTDSQRARPLIRQGSISATSSRFLALDNAEPVEQFVFMAAFPSCQNTATPALDEILEAHVPESDLPMDTCSAAEPSFPSLTPVNRADSTRVSLLDVGDMFLLQGQKRLAIPTRTFPDLLQIVDGVMYSATHRNGATFVPGDTYTIRTTGTDEVAAFEAVLDAPEDLGEVRVNGVFPGEQMPTISAGMPVSLTWEGAGYGDEVIARLSWTSMGLSWSMHCRMRDDGAFTVTPAGTRNMREDASGNDFEMVLSRVRQVSFRARGLDFGDFNFVASTSFFIRFEESQ